MGSSRSHKEEKRNIFQRIFSTESETIKPPAKTPPVEATSHTLGQGTAQKAGALMRSRKRIIDSAVDKATE